jgi:Ca-activated chloride channel family protein
MLGGCSQDDSTIFESSSYDANELDWRPTEPWIEDCNGSEEYDIIDENPFLDAIEYPLSTFSIDVDGASYSNVRRFLNEGRLPPRDAVRIEEMINYFSYDYPQPSGQHPFSVTTEVSDCPWEVSHQLIHIGLQGESMETDDMPPSNLVFLIDVSGSMQASNKLPLLKQAFRLLVPQLRSEDQVAIVTYAGSGGLALPSTSGSEQEELLSVLDRLEAGGSTAGAAGIELAYEVALENFAEEGNNRVILATDGDFNVGISSDEALVTLIESKRDLGVFLTVLGFGTGNLEDSKMEKLANHGNGTYNYIDNLAEAEKVFVHELVGTLVTIAKDVKIQVEFNSDRIASYRLIGYENRLLDDDDFDDDSTDAGDMGAGHSVTALYEIVPVSDADARDRSLIEISFRYKDPDMSTSQIFESTVTGPGIPLDQTSDNYRFSAAVAQLGLLLRDSEHMGESSVSNVLELAKSSIGSDEGGYRGEFVELAEGCARLLGEQ